MFDTTQQRSALPRFKSPDKGLENALNLLRDAIMGVHVPNIRMMNGTQEWDGTSLLLRPNGSTTTTTETSDDYIPWAAEFYTEDDTAMVRFNLGTVNGVPATNWHSGHVAPDSGSYKFVVLTISTYQGGVSSLSISLSDSSPSSVANNVAKDTPPAEVSIVLGAVGSSDSHMNVTTNLAITPVELFKESKTAPAEGAEPFHRWWGWEVSY